VVLGIEFFAGPFRGTKSELRPIMHISISKNAECAF
jgi:hypothetical protein